MRRPGDDSASRATARAGETRRPDRADRVDLSEQAQRLLTEPPADTDPGVRTGLVRSVRTLIDAGFYDTSEQIDETVAALLDKLGEEAQAAGGGGEDHTA